MTKEQQLIAIAEACGWYKDRSWEINHLWNHPEVLISAKSSDLPDYLNDLNAFHETEKVLTPTQQAAYFVELHRSLHRGCMSLRHQQWIPVICATAAQRAEAFLRAIGKWIEKPGLAESELPTIEEVQALFK